MTKKYFLLFIICFFGISCYSQDTIPVWTKHFVISQKKGANNGKYFLGIDKNNNSFVVIDFVDSLSIGDSLFINKTKLSSLVIKFDNNGNLIWMYPIINKGDIRTFDIVVDGDGNCYLSGIYHGEFPISSTITLDSTAVWGCSYLAKINSAGHLVWAKGFSNASRFHLSLNQKGDLFVKSFVNQGTNYQLGDTILPISGKEAIAKFDTSGNFYWAKTFTHMDGLVADSFDNIFIFADFDSKVVLDTFILNPLNSSRPDIYIAKLNSNGLVQWVQHFDNVKARYIYKENLTTDNTGAVYFASTFTDSIGILNHKYYSPQYDKIFFVKIDSQGRIIWVNIPDENAPFHEGISCINYTSDKKIKGKIKISNSTNFNGHTIPNIGYKGVAFIEMDTTGIVTNLRPLILNDGYLISGSKQSYFQLSGVQNGDSIKVLGKFYKSIQPYDYFLVKYDTSFYNSIKNDLKKNLIVNLYPNPAKSICYISSEQELIVGLQMYNILGKLTKVITKIHSNLVIFEVNTLAKGIYFLKIELITGDVVSKKIIID